MSQVEFESSGTSLVITDCPDTQERQARAGRLTVLVGPKPEGFTPNIFRAHVPSWDKVPDAIDWFRALVRGPKVQIEGRSGVPGYREGK